MRNDRIHGAVKSRTRLFSRTRSPISAVIFPTQEIRVSGNRSLQASFKATASRGAVVNTSSKILAIGQSRHQGSSASLRPRTSLHGLDADGDKLGHQLRTALARCEQMPQIARQSIADIHHGMNGEMAGKPSCLNQPRLEIEMFSRNAATQVCLSPRWHLPAKLRSAGYIGKPAQFQPLRLR